MPFGSHTHACWSNILVHPRPISLTPTLSKVGEDFIVEDYVKPAVLAKIDKNQNGTVPNSSTTHALISMLHNWFRDTDGNGSTVRVMLFDFKKAFDFIDHSILMAKLEAYELPPWVLDWIASFSYRQKTTGKTCLQQLFGLGISQSWSTITNQIGALAFLSYDKRHQSQWRQPLEAR